jgi:hypothetical protein
MNTAETKIFKVEVLQRHPFYPDLKTMINDIHDYYKLYGNIVREFFIAVRTETEFDPCMRKINPTQYHTALLEFSKYGKLMRFPEKIINRWKHFIVYNTCVLQAITDICGHSQCFPIDEFCDEFEVEVTDFYIAWDILGDAGDDRLPKWSNGHDLISDYALKPLLGIVQEMWETDCPNKLLVLINRALDITHPRSDIAELFIIGGSDSLTKISNK